MNKVTQHHRWPTRTCTCKCETKTKLVLGRLVDSYTIIMHISWYCLGIQDDWCLVIYIHVSACSQDKLYPDIWVFLRKNCSYIELP